MGRSLSCVRPSIGIVLVFLCLPELVEESCMPHFFKCLGDVKECCGTILFVFKGVVDSLDDTVGLFYSGVSLSEAELVGGD
jgi:hypothetical protein